MTDPLEMPADDGDCEDLDAVPLTFDDTTIPSMPAFAGADEVTETTPC